MSKKVLLIIGILILVGVAIFLILSSGKTDETGTRVGFSVRDYFPFGRGEDTNIEETPTNTTPEEEPTNNIDTNPVPRLRKISNEPVSGSIVFNIGTTTFVRFVEKGTGNVYEARGDRNSIERLTNTTIPKIVRSTWLPNATGFLAQTVDVGNSVTETSFVKLNKSTAVSDNSALYNTTISKLPTGIEEIAISPDSTKIFYYLKGASSFWFTAKPDGTERKHLYTSPILEWIPKWVDNKNVFIYTKPSVYAETFAYNFNIDTKALKKTSVSGFGLSFNPSKESSLVSNGATVSVVNNSTLASSNLNTKTLADKCHLIDIYAYCAVPGGNSTISIDSWYKGLVSTSDYIIRIDTEDLFYSNIIDLSSEVEGGVDLEDLQVSEDESHLIFRNKKDGFLWMLRVEK